MQSRLGSSFVLALLGAAACGEPARSPPRTVVLPAVSPDSTPAPSAPPRSSPRAATTSAPSPDDAARAETLFREGRALMEQGKYLEACDHFAESMRFDPAVGTLLNWASCAERAGDTKRACELFAEARLLAQQKGSVEREKFAAQRLTQLGCP